MLSREQLEAELKRHPLVSPRVETLRLAEELNPQFHNPHIVGGYLRNIALSRDPNDCDVVFQGYQLNQPGVLEAVQEAEMRLGITPYPDWEFENITATGYSGDLYQDVVGRDSYHTDYLTMLMMDTKGVLYPGEEGRTLADLSKRIYDLRFAGIELWATHRGNGRSYGSCITGDLIRAFYLCQSLDVNPSPTAAFLMGHFDHIFNELGKDDQESRRAFWRKKTNGNSVYQPILDHFGVTSLVTTF